MNNPKEQEMYVQIETYANRNFPSSCNPNNYLRLAATLPNGNAWGTAYATWAGHAMAGPVNQKSVKGDYLMKVTDYRYKSGSKKAVTLSIYWKEEKGTQTALF